jgi:hypothetical protein
MSFHARDTFQGTYEYLIEHFPEVFFLSRKLGAEFLEGIFLVGMAAEVMRTLSRADSMIRRGIMGARARAESWPSGKISLIMGSRDVSVLLKKLSRSVSTLTSLV